MARVGKNKQPKKQTGKPRKEKIVEELTAKIEASNGLVFTDYKGLTSKQTEDIKKQLKEANASFSVTKNSLLKLSLSKSKYADLAKEVELEKPTATLFLGNDTIIPLKALAKAFKELNLPKIKYGIIDGQSLDEAGILKLASLPGREVLLGQLVGMLNSPIQGLVVTLNGTLQKLVIVLDAVAKAKPADAAPAPAEPAQPAPETEQTPETPAQAELTPAEPQPEEVAAEQTPTETEQPAEEKITEQPTENQEKTEGGDLNG